MDPSVSGLYAKPVYRSKITGGHISKEEFLETQKKKQKKEEKPKEIKLEWGKGLAQKQEAEARLEELEIEKDKPFARSRRCKHSLKVHKAWIQAQGLVKLIHGASKQDKPKSFDKVCASPFGVKDETLIDDTSLFYPTFDSSFTKGYEEELLKSKVPKSVKHAKM